MCEPVGVDALVAGHLVAVTFYTDGTRLLATRIVVVSPDTQTRVTDPERIEAARLRTAGVVGVTLDRFEKIIVKLENQITLLKNEGKDTTAAEALVKALPEADDKEAAIRAAREALSTTVIKTKEAYQDMRSAYETIRATTEV